jgi:hypothetical protein
MSMLPEAPPTDGPAIFGEAPPRSALVLAGLDIAAAAWLVFLDVGLRHAIPEDAGLDGATPHADLWSGLFVLTLVLGFFLLLISVAVLVKAPVRSEPKIFRVLLGATTALVLIPAAMCMLGGLVSGG